MNTKGFLMCVKKEAVENLQVALNAHQITINQHETDDYF